MVSGPEVRYTAPMTPSDRPRRRPLAPLAIVPIACLAAAFACTSSSDGGGDPVPKSSPPGPQFAVVPIGPAFDEAEVTVSVAGAACATRTLFRSAPRWTERGLCGNAANAIDLLLLPPAGRCGPGGLYLFSGSAVGASGDSFEVRSTGVAAWDEEGNFVEVASLPAPDARPGLVSQSSEPAWPGEDASLADARHWSYGLELRLDEVPTGCEQRILLSMISTPAVAGVGIQQFDYVWIEEETEEGWGVRIARSGPHAPLPSLEVGADVGWRPIPSLSSDDPDVVAFGLPSKPDGLKRRLVFPQDVIQTMQIVPKVAYEPREELYPPAWVTFTEGESVSVVIEDPIEAASEPASLESHLGAILAELTSHSLQEDGGAKATLDIGLEARLEASPVSAAVPLLLTPLLEFEVGLDHRSDCDQRTSVACDLAAAIEGALANIEEPDEASILALQLRIFSPRRAEGAVLHLRRLEIPLASIER